MCVIVYSPEGKKLDKKELLRAWKANNDGAGLIDLKRQKVIKGLMNFEDFYRVYEKIKGPYVFHFRKATSGSVGPENTHPFKFSGHFYLFHNGVLSIKTTGNKSDTATLAGVLNSKNFKTILEMLSDGNKFLVVDLKRKKVYLFGTFYNYKGLKVSNNYCFYSYDDYTSRFQLGFRLPYYEDYAYKKICKNCNEREVFLDNLCYSCYQHLYYPEI